MELQIDHGKGPFSAGLSAKPLAGGRADAAVAERSDKGSSRCQALGTCQKRSDGRSHDRRTFYDIVWHAKLFDKMQVGITGRMYQFVQTFLDSRWMALKVGHAKSQTHTLDMGVPQGSVIAARHPEGR